MRNIFFIILFILTFFNTKSFALEAEATTYKITITRIEICDSTSTDASCNNPIVLYSGNSGSIDIASTTAGAAAASLGDLSKVEFGKTYTYFQITMNRAFTVAGSVTSGATTCYTIASSTGTTSKNGIGSKTSGAAVAGTYYAGIPAGTSHGDVMNSTTAGDGTGTDSATGTVDAGDAFFEYREALSEPFTMEAGKIPTVKVAFGTSTALGYLEKAGLADDCTATAAADRGFYANRPDVVLTLE